MESQREKYPKEVDEILQGLYADDVITGGEIVPEVRTLKETAVAVFGEAQFELHKWHSNAPELEVSSAPDDCNQSYAKEQLRDKPGETKM